MILTLPKKKKKLDYGRPREECPCLRIYVQVMFVYLQGNDREAEYLSSSLFFSFFPLLTLFPLFPAR